MKSRWVAAGIMAMTSFGTAHADVDCRRPMAEWQPREAVSAHVTEIGITTEQLRIDDGCYEVRGRDVDGNRIELKLDPTTLMPIRLEVRFRPGADPARYLSGIRQRAAEPATPPASPPQANPVKPETKAN